MIDRNFDLNLLKVLVALLKEKNTYRAAEALGTSQPSVSRSLAKLRVLLDDPLFYRDKRGLRLSQRAEELEKTLPNMYSSLLDTFEASVFLPANYEGKIKIAMNAYIAELFGVEIYQHLTKLMPKLTIEIMNWSEHSDHLLLADQVDIAISFLPMDLPKNIIEKSIGMLKFGFIGNKSYFHDVTEFSARQLQPYQCSTVLIPLYNATQLKLQQLPGIDLSKNVALKSHHIAPLLNLTARSDVLFIAPEKLYVNCNNKDLCFINLKGVDDETRSAEIGLFYNAKYRQSPVYQWFEQEIKTIIQKNSL